MRPLQVCDICNGGGVVRCHVCEGGNVIRKTGNRKRNALNIKRAVVSRWTSVDSRSDHRHYVCSEVRIKEEEELGTSNKQFLWT